MRGDSGFWLWFWFVLQSFLVLLRGRRSGGVSVGKERVVLSGLADCLLLLFVIFGGVTVVGAVVLGGTSVGSGGSSACWLPIPLQRAIGA